MLEAFVNLDTEREEVRLLERNDTIGWAFRLILGITGLITEAERILDRLKDVTLAIEKEIRERDFKKEVEESKREEKRFKEFLEDEWQAFLGDARGQFAIGRAFAAGHPIKDWFRAYFWLSLAAAQGIKEAARFPDRIAKGMTRTRSAKHKRLLSHGSP